MINEKLLKILEPHLDTERIKNIDERIDAINDKTEIVQLVEELQTMNNGLYDLLGMCDETLEFQLFINGLRNKFDVTDPREVVHVDNGKGFVQ